MEIELLDNFEAGTCKEIIVRMKKATPNSSVQKILNGVLS